MTFSSRFLTLIIILTLPFAVHAKTYYLKGKPKLGSRFDTRIASSSIPFNKRYKDMSVKEQTIIRANYENMPVDETPPFPKKGTQAIYKPLIKFNQSSLSRGDLVAIAVIDESGIAQEVQIYAAPDNRIAQFLAALLFEIEYDPGMCSGQPCQTEYLIDVGLNVSF